MENKTSINSAEDTFTIYQLQADTRDLTVRTFEDFPSAEENMVRSLSS